MRVEGIATAAMITRDKRCSDRHLSRHRKRHETCQVAIQSSRNMIRVIVVLVGHKYLLGFP
jgi:hypothetical protein